MFSTFKSWFRGSNFLFLPSSSSLFHRHILECFRRGWSHPPLMRSWRGILRGRFNDSRRWFIVVKVMVVMLMPKRLLTWSRSRISWQWVTSTSTTIHYLQGSKMMMLMTGGVWVKLGRRYLWGNTMGMMVVSTSTTRIIRSWSSLEGFNRGCNNVLLRFLFTTILRTWKSKIKSDNLQIPITLYP